MNIHTAYTIYNNGIQSIEPQLAEAIDRIIDAKSKAVDRYKECYEICERGMHRAHDLYKDSQEKLDKVELAEFKARIELEVIDTYYSALLKKRVLQVEELQAENERLREIINEKDEREFTIAIGQRLSKRLAGESK
ncbi:hypothetical protein ACH0B6_19140 [Solibacillus silvestris]